jgi:hypothetical protein
MPKTHDLVPYSSFRLYGRYCRRSGRVGRMEGAWPPSCSFFSVYKLNSLVGGKSVDYEGFWPRLRVDAAYPKGKSKGSLMPILDITYGRFEL